jgi:hypothetical protein
MPAQIGMGLMTTRDRLTIAFYATLAALALLVAAVILALTANPPAGQEQFEVVGSAGDYAARLAAAGPGLRRVLFIDGLFPIVYTLAIGFTILAFADNCRPAAWVGGIGILAVMLLDGVENAVMVQSLDLIGAGGALTPERIGLQALVSAMKWQISAAALFATGFVLPSDTALEKLLVWGVRLGLPVAVPLFLTNAFGLREVGGLLLLVSMLGGFILLALALRSRLKRS